MSYIYIYMTKCASLCFHRGPPCSERNPKGWAGYSGLSWDLEW